MMWTVWCYDRERGYGPFHNEAAASRYAGILDVDTECECEGHRVDPLQPPLLNLERKVRESIARRAGEILKDVPF